MKRIIALILNMALLLLLGAALFSCGPAETDENDDNDADGKNGSTTGETVLVGEVTLTGNLFNIRAEDEAIYSINTSDETKYLDVSGKSITKSDIKIGDKVRVTHTGIVTRSIPPQVVAVKIEVLPGSHARSAAVPEESFVMTAEVVSVGDRLLVNVIAAEYASGEYYVNVESATPVYDKDGSLISPSSISVGDKLKIFYTGQVMLSLPPQIIALEIEII